VFGDCFLVPYIEEKLVDFLTKALPPLKSSSFVSKLGMINIYHGPTCGRLLKCNRLTAG